MSARELHHAPSLGKRLEPFLVIANALASQLIQLLYTFANGRIFAGAARIRAGKLGGNDPA